MSAPAFVVVGSPSSRRIELFQAALSAGGLPPAKVVSYVNIISGGVNLRDVIEQNTVVRIESPGKDFDAELAVLALGEEAASDEGSVFICRAELSQMAFDRGRILAPRQWYLGYVTLLDRIKQQLADSPPHRKMNDPDDIAVMFDKGRCYALMHAHELPVPRHVGEILSFEQLKARMHSKGMRQVFVKLNHGSSASGVVAYRTNGRSHKALTTVEMVQDNEGLRLYNSRRIRTLENEAAIAALIDELCRHRVHVEEWFPKAKLSGNTFDLRVVVIGGKARHVVKRESKTPFTNLHLLNKRCDPRALIEELGEEQWQQMMRCCENAVAPFSGSLYAGVDFMIGSNLRSHAIAEINAFGDHIESVFWQRKDTYTAELESMGLLNRLTPV